MKTLDEITADDFKDRVGETFTIGKKNATLKAVDVRPAGHKMFRDQVSLLFEADEDLEVDSGLAKVAHAELGRLDLLVHRIDNPDDPEGKDAKPLYEIMFT